jgi:very-short-patch-repair endonuclease
MPQFRSRPTKRAQQLRNSTTDAEQVLWWHLRSRQLEGYKFSRQMPVGPFICDFLCRKRRLIVELDGGQHAENAKDVHRTAFLEQQGYRVIRFWNNDVLCNVEGVLQTILQTLTTDPPPTPSRMREGKSREAAKGRA